MSEPTALSMVLEPLGIIARGIYTGLSKIHWSWWMSRLGSLLALPFHILAVPLKFLFGLAYVVFAPVVYVLTFIWSTVTGVVGFIVSLEPLYTFFGVAAFIGLLTGLVLALSSTILTTNLNLQDSPSTRKSQPARRRNKFQYLQGDSEHEYSSPETTDWNWVDTSPVRRKAAPGLLSQTIHEEDDSSD